MKRCWLTPPQIHVAPLLVIEINNNNIFNIVSQVESKESTMYDKASRKNIYEGIRDK